MLETLRSNPYRLFFPLGTIFALIGVGEWAFWSVGWTVPAISFTHATLQTQGFLSCFVAGFLMTAFPRFTGTEPAKISEIAAGFFTAVLFLLATLSKKFPLGQVLFLLLVTLLIVFAARRLPKRTKPLPPSFLLMGFGFLHALTGPILVLLSHFGDRWLSLYTIGRQMTQLGFLLCMVMGITGQLAPFLMGYTAEPAEKTIGTKGVHAIMGALVYASFWLIPIHERAAFIVRALVVTTHLLLFARIARPVLKKTVLIYFFTTSLRLIPVGLWLAALSPSHRIAALHCVFIGGFSLMIFSFGQLVILSHSHQAHLLNGKLITLKIVGTCVLLAMALRVLADFSTTGYMMLIHSASGLWVAAALVWLIYLSPKMYARLGRQI